MCGIAGFWGAAGADGEPPEEVAGRMADAVATRGPDDRGTWADPAQGIALGHRRLSIVDLSPCGHQPMEGPGGRWMVAYNGEVYNFQALRRELEGRYAFRGHSDTEVLLAAVDAWGVEGAVGRFVGMFAFALWDRERSELHLVRDRLGIKPLYYGWMGGTLLFGSELKALQAHPRFRGVVDRGALTLLLRHNCIPAPYSIWEGVRKLPPGCILTLRTPDDSARPRAFWSAREAAERGMAAPFRGTEGEATDRLEALLREAVGLRMIADVPLGAFLSGGIDSSTVVALMQAQSSRPVKTFSIGFQEGAYDEARHAAAVARHLGTDHTELYVAPGDALAVIPRLASMYDEPFADSSQIPTFLVSELARRHVTVALSGDGGDELFAGYNRHVWSTRVGGAVRRVPRALRAAGARALTALSPAGWDRVYRGVAPVLPPALRQRMPGDKMHKLASVIPSAGPLDLYRRLASHWTEPASVVRGAAEPPTLLTDPGGAALGDFTAQMMYWDLVTYLPDDILTKVDRASMAVALEARVPLLDHRVVEFAWTVPLSMKLRGGQGKWLLRQVLYRHVPPELVERPKMGFGLPLGDWLRGPLRPWAEELLDERRLRREGFLDPVAVRRHWAEHLSGRHAWQYHLWDVLMFQSWLESQRVPAPPEPAFA
ncbi:MAG TPA: asparagine synthase (glutamine-hydrolyzing) [Longimicrobium sp.]|nr:asparagine synthase (glutamine-hydrolyzing) [Longimicrobium sp.]